MGDPHVNVDRQASKRRERKVIERGIKLNVQIYQQEIMTPYSMIGFIKLPEEQGRWAARTAIKVLNGEKISSIPLGRPDEGRMILNKLIAESKGLRFPESFTRQADRIIE